MLSSKSHGLKPVPEGKDGEGKGSYFKYTRGGERVQTPWAWDDKRETAADWGTTWQIEVNLKI